MIFLRLYVGTYMRTCCSLHPPADAAHVTHDGDEDDDGGGDTGWDPIGCRRRASLFIQWNADLLKVPTQLRQRPLCVCVCVSVRGRCVWRVRGVMEGLGWPVEEGGAKGLLHKTKAPYAAASLSLSVFICQPLLSLYLWPAFILNGLTYFSQYSA